LKVKRFRNTDDGNDVLANYGSHAVNITGGGDDDHDDDDDDDKQ